MKFTNTQVSASWPSKLCDNKNGILKYDHSWLHKSTRWNRKLASEEVQKNVTLHFERSSLVFYDVCSWIMFPLFAMHFHIFEYFRYHLIKSQLSIDSVHFGLAFSSLCTLVFPSAPRWFHFDAASLWRSDDLYRNLHKLLSSSEQLRCWTWTELTAREEFAFCSKLNSYRATRVEIYIKSEHFSNLFLIFILSYLTLAITTKSPRLGCRFGCLLCSLTEKIRKLR